jgi:predicted component of type VI protein secretion system
MERCPGVPPRERCLSVGALKEKEQAVALVAAYREAEELADTHDIEKMSLELV